MQWDGTDWSLAEREAKAPMPSVYLRTIAMYTGRMSY